MSQLRFGILDVGVFCPVGLNALQAAASVRAGISRKQESSFIGRNWEPIVLGMLPDDVLPPLSDDVEAKIGPTSLQRRLLRLASPALQEVAAGVGDMADVPVLLAAPRPAAGRQPIVDDGFLQLLADNSGVASCLPTSRTYPVGHAGMFHAIAEAAASNLFANKSKRVIVGGVDSYVDPYRLELLQEEKRLSCSGVMDGFTPGEGAAFLVLATMDVCRREKLTPLACLDGVGLGTEKGHRYSDEPYLGDGLAEAFSKLFASASAAPEPARTVFAGFNGESFHTKEWGVAYQRHTQQISGAFQIEHPAEYAGDMGAALAPAMLAFGAIGLNSGYTDGPCVVWASSDEAERGAALVSAAAP